MGVTQHPRDAEGRLSAGRLRLQLAEPRGGKQYLNSDSCLLGHGLVHADESHIVIQVIDRTLSG